MALVSRSAAGSAHRHAGAAHQVPAQHTLQTMPQPHPQHQACLGLGSSKLPVLRLRSAAASSAWRSFSTSFSRDSSWPCRSLFMPCRRAGRQGGGGAVRAARQGPSSGRTWRSPAASSGPWPRARPRAPARPPAHLQYLVAALQRLQRAQLLGQHLDLAGRGGGGRAERRQSRAEARAQPAEVSRRSRPGPASSEACPLRPFVPPAPLAPSATLRHLSPSTLRPCTCASISWNFAFLRSRYCGGGSEGGRGAKRAPESGAGAHPTINQRHTSQRGGGVQAAGGHAPAAAPACWPPAA